MFNNTKRKQQRLNSGLPDFITTNTYNLVIGLVVLYGFAVNAIIVATCSHLFMRMNPIAIAVGYFVLCLLGIVITCSKNPIVSFIGYNLIVLPVGALLSVCLPTYETADIVAAFITTGVVVAVMLVLSTSFPKLFSKLGAVLFFTLLVSTVAQFIAVFIFDYGGNAFNWLFVVLFSLYIGYDWYKAQRYPKTIDNAVDSALDIYLDIICLFVNLLEIFSKSDD